VEVDVAPVPQPAVSGAVWTVAFGVSYLLLNDRANRLERAVEDVSETLESKRAVVATLLDLRQTEGAEERTIRDRLPVRAARTEDSRWLPPTRSNRYPALQ